ncbi:hypothetical protein RI367_008545 [Sorochytrium milnesiophthora]
MFCVPKSDDPFLGDVSKLRPITLLETAHKLMMTIIIDRMSTVCTHHSVLRGLNSSALPGTSTDAPIATILAATEAARATGQPLAIYFEDKSKAFDSVGPGTLERSLRRMKLPDTFVRMYMAEVAVYDVVLCHIARTQSQHGFRLPGRDADDEGILLTGVAYVDDAAWISSTTDGMQAIVAAIDRFNDATAIRANAQKGSLLKLNQPREAAEVVSSSGAPIPQLHPKQAVRYLGVLYRTRGYVPTATAIPSAERLMRRLVKRAARLLLDNHNAVVHHPDLRQLHGLENSIVEQGFSDLYIALNAGHNDLRRIVAEVRIATFQQRLVAYSSPLAVPTSEPIEHHISALGPLLKYFHHRGLSIETNTCAHATDGLAAVSIINLRPPQQHALFNTLPWRVHRRARRQLRFADVTVTAQLLTAAGCLRQWDDIRTQFWPQSSVRAPEWWRRVQDGVARAVEATTTDNPHFEVDGSWQPGASRHASTFVAWKHNNTAQLGCVRDWREQQNQGKLYLQQ